MRRVGVAVVLVALLVLAASQVWLALVERDGPPRRWVELPGGVPATLYTPGPGPVWPPPPPPPPGERPPALVLVHGQTGDQVGLSGLARSLVSAGFAVLTLDLRGHGRNRRPFDEGAGLPEQFDLEIGAAVDYLRRQSAVDGARIALAGTSMGAGAVLEYASRDTAVDAVILIAGGWERNGPHRPPNAFFVYAEYELPFIPEAVNALASELAGERVAPDRTYGDIADATAVRLHVVAGADHGSIIRFDETVREISEWLDGVWGLSRDAAPVFADPRMLPSRVALAAFVVVLLGLGGAAGRMASRFETAAARPESRLAHLVPIGVSLFALLPFFSLWFPGFLLGRSEADPGVTYLASAGLVLLFGLVSSGTLSERFAGLRAGAIWGSLAVGAGSVAAGYVLLVPWAVTLRGMSLTPERAVLALWIAVLLLPFGLAFHVLTAGGSAWRATAVRVAARLLVIAAFSVGLWLEVFFFPTRTFVAVLVVNALWLELVFGPYYARSRNTLAAAVLESLWLGWQLAAVLTVSL